ncbi:MAG TPA: protein phosphatase 2C domain-containing protein [Syntrophomonadaceae bacterium]|nr:protein phosphatase 2C domain-containing protein [Syntrophomonadaceae bacterium]
MILGVIFIFNLFKKKKKEKPAHFHNIYRQMNGLLNIVPGNAQDIGRREEQQDSFLFSDMENPELVAKIGVLAVLADGMGGLKMGREASTLAVRTFLVEYSTKTPEETIPEELKRSTLVANGAVFDMATRSNLAWNTGTTLVAAVVDLDELYWISVGDSHIYLFRDQTLTQLNRDHNYSYQLQTQVSQGILTQEEADVHPERNALTSFLGMDVLGEIDQNLQPINLKPGDRILLCSDGLHGVLSPEEIIQALGYPAQEAAELLLTQTLSKSLRHQDNVTVAILACEPSS